MPRQTQITKLHNNEADIDLPLVRSLLSDQFPQWADLDLTPVSKTGTDNIIFRLGDDKLIRLPRIPSAALLLAKEFDWLPALAPHLPLAVSVPIGRGRPSNNYPFAWSIYSWIEGENIDLARMDDAHAAAQTVAEFINALHAINSTNIPSPKQLYSSRGVPLATRDANTRQAIATLDGQIDTQLALKAWEQSMEAPAWQKPPVWIHGDLQAGNVLMADGKLTAVIDFGCLTLGDPACDMAAGWNLFSAETRQTFKHAVNADNAAWLRGRGWALSCAVIALPYYQHTDLALVDISRYAIDQILTEVRQSG